MKSHSILNVFIGFLFLSLTDIHAQSDQWNLPDSPAGKAASAILSAIEKGDDESITHFLKENLNERFFSAHPLQDHLRFLEVFITSWGLSRSMNLKKSILLKRS